MQLTVGGEAWALESAVLSCGLGDTPNLSMAIPGQGKGAFHALAAARSRGTVKLGEGTVAIEVTLTGVTAAGKTGSAEARGVSQWVHAAVGPEPLFAWFDQPASEAGATQTLVLQRSMTQPVGEFLGMAIGDDLRLSNGGEDELVAPAPGACLVRPGWMSNRVFLRHLCAEIAWRDPRLLGWRVAPADNGRIVFAVAKAEPIQLAAQHWRATGVMVPGAPFRLEGVREAAKLASLGDVLPALFSDVLPRDRLLAADADIPAVPQLARAYGRTWLVTSTILHITDAGLKDVKIELVDPPAPVPLLQQTMTLPSLVRGWSADGSMLTLDPLEGGNWSVASTAGTLLARALTPASFADGRGGMYVRTVAGDPRVVCITPGEIPESPGAIMKLDKSIEDAGVDIALAGAALSLSAAEGASVATLTEGHATTKAVAVDITGSVKVSGDLDVS